MALVSLAVTVDIQVQSLIGDVVAAGCHGIVVETSDDAPLGGIDIWSYGGDVVFELHDETSGIAVIDIELPPYPSMGPVDPDGVELSHGQLISLLFEIGYKALNSCKPSPSFGYPYRSENGTTMVARIIPERPQPAGMSEQRDGEGRYTSSVADQDLLHYFNAGQRAFHSANEVANEFGFDRTQAYRRLSSLADRGELQRVEIGKRNVVWWRPRDVVVLIEEDAGYSIIDRETGVASQGETRSEALRMLAEAIEVYEGESDLTPEEIYEELDIDPEEIPSDAAPPWE